MDRIQRADGIRYYEGGVTQRQAEASLKRIITAATLLGGEGSLGPVVHNLEAMKTWSGELGELKALMRHEVWRPPSITGITIFENALVPFLQKMQINYNGLIAPSQFEAFEEFIGGVVSLLSGETQNILYSFMYRHRRGFTDEFYSIVVEGIVKSGNAPHHLLRAIEGNLGNSEYIRSLARKADS